MSYNSRRQALATAISTAFSGSLPPNLPRAIREDIIRSNRAIGFTIADAILNLIGSMAITKQQLELTLAGTPPLIDFRSLIT